MIVLLDNGHGRGCPNGSPDKRIMEYSYAREIVRRVRDKLTLKGIEVKMITPEEEDIKLQTRCNRVNHYCSKYGKNNCLFISIHLNAAGSQGKWMTAEGWECYTTKGNTNADLLAEDLYSAAQSYGFRLRKDLSDGDSDKESGLYVLKHTQCPAVLTENLFQDNREEVDYLLSEKGKRVITDIHVKGIVSYINRFCKK